MPTTVTPAGSSKKSSAKGARGRATAEQMASRQREISVSEFFAKNRHLLGFDNPRKALLTTVKEAVDNALDACEEGGILPCITVELLQLAETRFKVTIRDNGPGIVRKQIENIFGKLLYGSKFHRMKMSRGQQGIGISAAGMYGLMTTGQPVVIVSKTGRRRPSHEVVLKMDTARNRAEVISETEHPEDDALFEEGHGTQVTIELEGRYQKGRASVDEYLEQTAIANPHAKFVYVAPSNETIEFPRAVDELPPEAKEIKPHPKGIELGTLIQMLERTEKTQLGAFFKEEFCRVGPRVAKEICAKSDLTDRTWIKQVGHSEAEALYKAIQDVRIMAPPTDCLVPIGTKAMLAGLLKEVRAEFFAASSRPAAVYRGNPFQIEVGIAYGRPGDTLEMTESGKIQQKSIKKNEELLMGNADEPVRLIRFANRVPLVFQQAACAITKAVVGTNWKNYGLQQPRGALPIGPMVIFVHIASVWVPFTSESKEAIAGYDEIMDELKRALMECGRKLGTHVRKGKKLANEFKKRNYITMYIPHVVDALKEILELEDKEVERATGKLTDVLERSRKL